MRPFGRIRSGPMGRHEAGPRGRPSGSCQGSWLVGPKPQGALYIPTWNRQAQGPAALVRREQHTGEEEQDGH
jgi:hypothetical protein